MVWKSEILTSSLVCFDEYHEANKNIRKNNLVYIQGEKYITVEDKAMKIEPVPILIYNPKVEEGIGERIKFEPQHMRRSIVCDFSNVNIDEKEREKGEKILQKLQELPNLSLSSHKSNCEKYREMIFKFLPECLQKDCGFIVDCEMILMLCSGMTAFLPEQKAVLLILKRYLTVIETLGYLKKNWRERLDELVNVILNNGGIGYIGNDDIGNDQVSHSQEYQSKFPNPIHSDHPVSNIIPSSERCSIIPQGIPFLPLL